MLASRRFGLVASAGLLLGAWGAAAAVADMANVYLKDGTTLRGDVTVTDTEVVLRNPAGEKRYARDQVARIEWLKGEPGQTGPATPATAPTQVLSVDAEYAQRFKALKSDDFDGHFALAQWCQDRQRWDLVKKQCSYILGLAPDYANAKLLLELANNELSKRAEAAQQKTGAKPEEEESGAPAAPLLSEHDIQRLKLYEYSLDGPPEKLRVRFPKKERQQEVEQLVVRDLKGDPDFDAHRERQLLQGAPFEKLRLILKYTGMKYADRIEIIGDTEKFATFRRKIVPLLQKSCMNSGCHGSGVAEVFRFPAGSRQSEPFAYTSFLLLDRMVTSQGPLLDRGNPEDSVLLGFMLPPDATRMPHPPVDHKRITPALRGTSDRNYSMIKEWIGTLIVPHPAYKLEYAFPNPLPPASQPAASQPASTQPAREGGERRP